MNKNNPFPGMNPFLERFWPDVHLAIIGYIRDEIAGLLPPGLKARGEENISLAEPDDKSRIVRPDVAVVESWRRGVPPSWQPSSGSEADGAVIATTPEYIIAEEETERWLEISDGNGRIITVIEVLSPTNKGDGRDRYISKRSDYLSGGVNVVEIDLLRGGRHTRHEPGPKRGLSDTAPLHAAKHPYPVTSHGCGRGAGAPAASGPLLPHRLVLG
jgi:hypothetical protein